MDAGRKVCLDALMSYKGKQRLRSEFLFVIKFASWLPPSRVDALIADRLNDIRNTLEAIGSSEAQPAAGEAPENRFAIGLIRAQLQAEADFIIQSHDILLSGRPRSVRAGAGTAAGI